MRRLIWLVMSSFVLFIFLNNLIDLYNAHTPPGKVGRCYSLDRKDWDLKIKVLENGNTFSLVQLTEAKGKMTTVSYSELRARKIEEVKCEEND